MKSAPQVLALFAMFLLYPEASWAQVASDQVLTDLERSALNPSANVIQLGSKVAEATCVKCHGFDGVSTEVGIPYLAGQRIIYLYRELQAYQLRGRHNDSMNHATGFLNDEALLAVAAYYANLTPARAKPIESETPAISQAARSDPFISISKDLKKCVKCHGDDGNNSASGMPNLTAQDPDYFVHSMKAYLTGERDHKLMTKLAANMDETSLQKMSVFYAVQEPVRTETIGDGNADAGRLSAEACAGCHGEDGNASGKDTPSLAGQDARYFVKAMQAYKDGKRQHKQMFDAVESLSVADISNLATFYAMQDPIRRNVRTPLTASEWIVRCDRCHGIDGNSTDPRMAMLAGQDRTYLASALHSYIGSTRGSTAMHAMTNSLSEDDIEQIVEHYASREPKAVVYMQIPCEESGD